MKIQLFSDIHLEMKTSFPIIPKLCNTIVLAGDIGKVTMDNYKNFVQYCSETWTTVIYVFGNHEYYSNRSMETTTNKYIEFFNTFPNVHLLDNSYIEIDNYIFYGFTGWTKPIFNSTNVAKESLNDFNYIRMHSEKYCITDQQQLYENQSLLFKNFIESLDTTDKQVIVITHFCPIVEGLNPNRTHFHLDKYYCWDNIINDLNINTNKITTWCSGHTHWSYKINVNDIDYYANQVGYHDEAHFNSGLIILD